MDMQQSTLHLWYCFIWQFSLLQVVITSTFDFWSKRDIVVNALKIFLFQGNTQIGGALWFLQCLFTVTLLYGVIECILNYIVKQKRKIMQ